MNPDSRIEPLPAGDINTLTTVKPLASPPPPSSKYPAGAAEVPQHYKERATAFLQVSTFAATITFTIILTPRNDGQTMPGLEELAYANALFCCAIIGSVFVIIGVDIANAHPTVAKNLALNTILAEKEVKRAREAAKELKEIAIFSILQQGANPPSVLWNFRILLWFVHVVAGFVGLSIYAAFFIMIYATRLFLQYDGPFILGTVIYAVLGFCAISIWIFSLSLEQAEFLELGKNLGEVQENSGNKQGEV